VGSADLCGGHILVLRLYRQKT